MLAVVINKSICNILNIADTLVSFLRLHPLLLLTLSPTFFLTSYYPGADYGRCSL